MRVGAEAQVVCECGMRAAKLAGAEFGTARDGGIQKRSPVRDQATVSVHQ
jgi:hypothetical protein